MHEPRGTQSLRRGGTQRRITREHERHERDRMHARPSQQRVQRHRPIGHEEGKEALLREARAIRSLRLERMLHGQDLVQDDPERPHVDFGVVGVRQLPVLVQAAVHLRRDVRQRAHLRARAAVLGQPFRVVEVAELDADRERRRDQDVLLPRQRRLARELGEKDRWRDVAVRQLRCRELDENPEDLPHHLARPRLGLHGRLEDEVLEIPARVVFHRDVDVLLVVVPAQHPHNRDRVGDLRGVSEYTGRGIVRRERLTFAMAMQRIPRPIMGRLSA